MKLEEIYSEWDKDSKIDKTELGDESLKLPQLHSKYFKIFTNESLLYKKYNDEYKKLYRIKNEYYMGLLDQDTLIEHGWDPQPLKILKQDLPMYLESDSDIQTVLNKMELQKQKISFLESVIKQVNNRGYLIKNAIDWEKFKMGQ